MKTKEDLEFTTVTLNLPEELVQQIDRLAPAEQLTRDQWIRWQLRRVLDVWEEINPIESEAES